MKMSIKTLLKYIIDYPQVSIIIFLIFIIYIISKYIMVKINENSNENKIIKKLITNNINISVHKSSFYTLIFIYIIFDIVFYIFCMLSIINTITNLSITTTSISLIYLIISITFIIMTIQVLSHSHVLTNESLPVYRRNNHLFLILKIINNKMLVSSITSRDFNVKGEIIRISPGNKYIQNVSLLNYCSIGYIHNGILKNTWR